MKSLKVTLPLAIFTFLLSSLGVGAIQGQQAYVVELAALKKDTLIGTQTKTTVGGQEYHNYSSLNACTGNGNQIGAKVYSDKNGYSDYMDLDSGYSACWADFDKTSSTGAYVLYIKNNVFSPCKVYHNGIWYYN